MAVCVRLLMVWSCFMLFHSSYGFLEGLYCGLDNCYDLLGVTRDSSKSEVKRAYRKLAKKWHPDMHRKKEDKEEAVEMFQKIANAYEILQDDEERNDYNYMLDNPEEYYTNYYRYYRRRVAPKVDVRLVIGVTLTVISLIQYWSMWNNYNTAISYLATVPKYRLQAIDIAKKEGLIDKNKKKDRSKTKEEIKQEEESIVRSVIEQKMDIRGGYSRPSVVDVLWLQLILSPYYLLKYISWFARWIWKFTILREEYGEEEKLYIIRRNMKLKQSQFDALEDHEIEDFLERELWIKENYEVWKKEKEEEAKVKMAENSRYKAYRRYMKKGGAGQMTFGPE